MRQVRAADMLTMTAQRSLPPKIARMRARKRQKVDGDAEADDNMRDREEGPDRELEFGLGGAEAGVFDEAAGIMESGRGSKDAPRWRVSGPVPASDAGGHGEKKVGRAKKAKGLNRGKVQRGEERENLRLESLTWTEVEAPEHMEDYEGFFGLEEVEGVDVVREGGTVAFRAAGERSGPVDGEGERGESDAREGIDVVVNGGDEGSDWEGFGSEDRDDTELEQIVSKPDAGPKNETDPEKSIPKDKRRRKSGNTKKEALPEDDGSATPNAFDILADHSDTLTTTDSIDTTAWRPLNLQPYLHAALSSLGFSNPTPIQSAAIPKILAGLDVIGKAPTGSGKTLAFGLPIIQAWLESRSSVPRSERKANEHADKHSPLALIIEPTRELATQVAEHLRAVCKASDPEDESEELERIAVCTITGGLSIQKQRRLLQQADVVVATPGRLWEVVSEGHGVLELLKELRFLVVDEADRLLAEGRFAELERVLDALERTETVDPRIRESDGTMKKAAKTYRETEEKVQRQTLVFSATFSSTLQQKLSHRSYTSTSTLPTAESMAYLLRRLPFAPNTKPTFIDTSPSNSMAPTLREGLLECPGAEKDLYLYTLLLHQPPGTRALVFVNSIAAVQRLVPFLENLHITAFPLHSHMPQPARLRSVERFSSATYTRPGSGGAASTHITALVSTDLAARGLDIPSIGLIVHYHVPRTFDTYIHRSGRTARAQASGTSVLMCAAEEAKGVRRLVARVHAGSGGGRNSDSDESSSKEGETPDPADGGDSNRKPSAPTPAQKKKKKRAKSQGLTTLTLPPAHLVRLKPRANLSKGIADAGLAKSKLGAQETWLRAAAEELGVDLEDPDVVEGMDVGRGRKRKVREREAAGRSRGEVRGMRAELAGLLGKRVNVGVSERYIAGGGRGVDLGALLRAREGGGGVVGGEFLGEVGGLGF